MSDFLGFGVALSVSGGETREARERVVPAGSLLTPGDSPTLTPRENLAIEDPSIRQIFLDGFDPDDGLDPLGATIPKTWNGRQVWIIAHGWNGNNSALSGIATGIREAKPDDIILAIDWRQASHTEHTDGTGASIRC